MAYDRFLIAPINTGLQKDLVPFLIPEDAFQEMGNALVYRGRVKKRFGYVYSGNPPTANNSRLRMASAFMTDINGDFNHVVASPDILGIGSQFTVGSATYTVWQASGDMLATSGAGTFDVASVTLTLTGAPALSTVYMYPSLPVMGLTQFEVGPVNNQPAFAFDTRRPYKFNGTSWEVQDSSLASGPIFHGTDTDFFWSCNYKNFSSKKVTLFTTNFNATLGDLGAAIPATDDPIWTWDGTDWKAFYPGGGVSTQFDTTGNFVYTARIIVLFHNRLVLLNTIEQDVSDPMHLTNYAYPQRARWCALGDPFSAGAWLIPGTSYGGQNARGGAFNDAATQERIISAEFIKDRLIVYFESSTYELVYTNNQVNPFVWQKINTELGAIGTFSVVPFDKAVLGIGKTGVHACSGANVARIDQKIPDEVFSFKVEDNAYNRIAGIRDYQPELVYWSYVPGDASTTQAFPTSVMVYNYQNETWSFNSDCMTAFGYFEQQSDLIWQDATDMWEEAGYAWNSNVEPALSRQVIFGNQQGFVCKIQQDQTRNAGNMQITNLTQIFPRTWQVTCINHNLDVSTPYNDWVLLEFDNSTSYNSNITIAAGSDGIFPVVLVTDKDTFLIDTQIPGTTDDALSFTAAPSGYRGHGTIARVSRINITSKQWNPYLKEGNGVYLAKIVFGTLATSAGSIQVDYMVDDSPLDMVTESNSSGTGVIMGTNVLEMFVYPNFDTAGANRLWHPIYFQGNGFCVQIKMYYSDEQMPYAYNSLAEFEVQGIILLTQRSSMRFV